LSPILPPAAFSSHYISRPLSQISSNSGFSPFATALLYYGSTETLKISQSDDQKRRIILNERWGRAKNLP